MTLARADLARPTDNGFSARDLDQYLSRIDYSGPLAPDFDTLASLQEQHVAAIPFEAIDVLLGKVVSLEPAAVRDKLVRRRRGGYCYEQNGLFSEVLTYLGFEVSPRVARVLWSGRDRDAKHLRTHMALQVKLSGTSWLVDVGFGAAVPNHPLRLDESDPQDTPGGRYRVTPQHFSHLVEFDLNGIWRPAYEVFHEPPQSVDFEVFNWFTSTHPESPFARNLILARVTRSGRFTLFDDELTHRPRTGEVTRRRLGEHELKSVLEQVFGLAVEPDWLPIISRSAS